MKVYISILLIGLTIVAHAQRSVSGTITNSQNEPLFGVDVFIEELHKGTSTNENGYYELNNLPNNSIKLTVAFIGFETQIKTLNLQQNETVLNFILQEAVFKMDEIIVSTAFNKLQSENVMKVERATAQQLKNKGAATLIEGLSSIAGVSQVSTGIGIGKPVIRGLRGNRVLVYTQGIRLENQQFGDEHGLGIDESSIESVEVIKGPASLLYGSDALGGVLYFNPTKFAEANSFNLNINQSYYANTQGSNTSFGVKQTNDSWKFLVNGARNQHSDYKTGDNERVTNTRFNETIFNTAIGHSNSFISSTLRFNFNNTKVGIPEEIGIQNTHKTPLYPYQDLTNKMVSFNNIFFLPTSKITSTFGYTFNNRKEFELHHEEGEVHAEEEVHPEEELVASLNLDLKTFSYDVKWNLPKSEKVETIIGIQGLNQKNKNFGEEILIPNATTNDFGAFLTSSFDWKQHSLQGGIRFDTRAISSEKHIVLHEDEAHVFEAIDNSFENFSASLGYKTTLFKKITSRFNFASGFKAPNLAELTSNGIHHGSNRFEIGNSALKNEKNFQSDIALEYYSKHFEIFANGFYNHINNYIFINPTGEFEDEYAIYKYTQENANLYGGEFGFHLHPHPLDWLHLQSSFDFIIGKQNNGNYLPLIPAHKLTNTLRAEYDINNWLKNGFTLITVESNFKQKNISEFETATNNYNLVNIGTGGKINISKMSFNINLNINNLFNTSYFSHLSRLKTNGIPNIGRNFITSIKFEI
ncbi:iron complex outermembrane receptor protein [Lutibacter oceani]|uniref:Iron complex outermembrane receptor protein n=1 Tax=Lutibacter oceani TaxID=1853311 RepID=A0A3D9RR74_9FLAO|nr:TonB-dependent receptor [Lutibacter oceani]REE79984.1 iron complex outermembrane receptor protein [Lutibacter oceani]